MSKYTVIGSGFLATAFRKRLNATWYPTEDTEVILYLGGPTHMDFERNPLYHMQHTGAVVSSLLSYCRDKNIKFVYTSSALVYERDTEFTAMKKAIEKTAGDVLPTSLGLRIFPVYGKGENRTAIAQWIREMKEGNQPVIYGDGTQKRDFINIEDVIDQTLQLIEAGESGVHDIGAGTPTSFNEIVWTINKVLGTSLEPVYVSAPEGYDKVGIYCENPLPTKVSLEEGIKAML